MKKTTLFFLATFLVSCSTTEEIYDDITAPDYVSSSKAKRLEIPPDLSELEQSNNYSVPGEAKSYIDYVTRGDAISENNNNNRKKLIANPEGMRIVKSGNLRWLIVDKDPDLIWPHVKDFWEELGFRIVVANIRTGIIETEWMDTDDLKLDSNSGALSTLDKWLDSLSGFADKRKFRTRVEYGENNTTEIYISQRSAEAAADQHSRILRDRQSDYTPSTIYKIEEYKSEESSANKKVSVSESRKIDDYEIDSELLTRIMIKLGATDFEAKKKVDNPEIQARAEFIENKEESYISMFDPYDRSWRRLGLALDIIGFLTEDKNRSEGIYYVRFSEVELPIEKKDEEEGIIDSLIFWDDDEKIKNIEENPSGTQKEQEINSIENESSNDEGDKFTGIEAPKIKPISEDYNIEEYESNETKKPDEEKTWLTDLWPSWGDEDDKNFLPDNEKRYRVRIKTFGENKTKVFLDYPSGNQNNSPDARKVLQIIYEHLK